MEVHTYKEERAIDSIFTGGSIALKKREVAEGEHTLLYAQHEVYGIVITDLETGVLRYTVKEEFDEFSAFTVHPTQDAIIAATPRSKEIIFYDCSELGAIQATRRWKSFPHKAQITTMVTDPSGRFLATGSSDRTVLLWDLTRVTLAASLTGHRGIITYVSFVFRGEDMLLLTGCEQGIAKLWRFENGRAACILTSNTHVSAVTGGFITSDGSRLVTAGRDKILAQWDIDSSTELDIHPVLEEVEAVIPYISKDRLPKEAQESELALIGGGKGQLSIWDLTNKMCIEGTRSEVMTGEIMYIRELNPEKLVVVTSDANFHIIDRLTLEGEKTIVGGTTDVLSLKFISNDVIVVATGEDYLRLHNLKTGNCDFLRGHSDTLLSVAYNERSGAIASVGKDKRLLITPYDVESGVIGDPYEGEGHIGAIATVIFGDSEGKTLYTAGKDMSIKMWSNNKKKRTILAQKTIKAHSKDINDLSLSPKGDLIASGSQDKRVKMWDARTLQLKHECVGHRRVVWCVRFSPTEAKLASSSSDGTIRIWSTADGSALQVLQGGEGLMSIYEFEFITRGHQLVSVGSDFLLKLWTPSSQQVVSFEAHTGKAWTIDTADGGGTLATGSGDGTVRLWRDISVELDEEKRREENDSLEKEQMFENVVRRGELKEVVRIGLDLKMPKGVYSAFEEILGGDDQLLQEILSVLEEKQNDELLKFVVEWNTNWRTHLVAQEILRAFVDLHGFEAVTNNSVIGSSLESLISYTNRHYNHLSSYLRKSSVLDVVIEDMRHFSKE